MIVILDNNVIVAGLLDRLVAHSKRTTVRYLWGPKLTDSNDDMVLKLAVSGSADAIVTFNKKDFSNTATKFGIEWLLPKAFYLEQ